MHEKPLYTTMDGKEVFSTEREKTPEEIAGIVAGSREADQENTRKNNPKPEGYMTPATMTKEVKDMMNVGVDPEEFETKEDQDDLPLAA